MTRPKNIILLTATIRPMADNFSTARCDPGVRRRDYEQALRFYLGLGKGVVDGILFLENSDADLSSLEAIAKTDNPDKIPARFIQALSDCPPDYGKGHAELTLMDKGYAEAIKGQPGITVVKSQSGEFTRAKGREVMETFLKSPEGKSITALFAHNDDMAIGAIEAIKAAGLKPGIDIKIVSIDAVKAAFESMAAGELNCTVECSPLLGPQLFDAVEAVMKGTPLPRRIVIPAKVYGQSTAAEDLKSRVY